MILAHARAPWLRLVMRSVFRPRRLYLLHFHDRYADEQRLQIAH
jgi:hypothetical protein